MIERIIPFYRHCLVSNRTVSKFNLSDVRFRRTSMNIGNLSSDQLDKLWNKNEKTQIDLIHVLPNDIYFCSDANNEIIKKLLSYSNEDKEITALIHNIDYSSIVKNITLLDRNKAAFNLGNDSYEIATIVTDKYITDAINGCSTELTEAEKQLYDLAEQVRLTEDRMTDRMNRKRSDRKNAKSNRSLDMSTKIKSVASYIASIEHHLRSNKHSEEVPLLIGLSGVAKSAIVKSIVKKLDDQYTNATTADDYKAPYATSDEVYSDISIDVDEVDENGEVIKKTHKLSYSDVRKYGVRLVDIRCGLMHYLDVQGMFGKKGDEIGDTVSYAAPPIEFLQCTDAYILFSRQMLEEMLPKIAECKQQLKELISTRPRAKKAREQLEQKIQQLEQTANQFRNSAKMPVLFFDEINRSGAEIKNTLMTLLSSKTYSNYSMRMCKMIAAANYPVGNLSSESFEEDEITNLSDLERLLDNYSASVEDLFPGIDDNSSTAFSSRFKTMKVLPEHVFPSWQEWAKATLHPAVVNYVKDWHTAYDTDFICEYCNADNERFQRDRELGRVPPYATYRAWQLISDYLTNIQTSGGIINPSIIEGFLGERSSDAFINYLKTNYSKLTTADDESVKLTKIKSDITAEKRTVALLETLKTCMSPLIEKEITSDDGTVSISRLSGDYIEPDIDIDKAVHDFPEYKLANDRINVIEDIIRQPDETSKIVSQLDDTQLQAYISVVDLLANSSLKNVKDTQVLYNFILNKVKSLKNVEVNDDMLYVIRKLINTAVVNEDFDFDQSVTTVKDNLTQFVENSLVSNTPIALIGVSGIGKSARVREAASRLGYTFYAIDLSCMQSCDALGVPRKVNLASQIGKNAKLLKEIGLDTDVIQAKLDKLGLFPETTIKAPRDEIKRIIETAEKTKVPVVLFFDEANRSPDATIQSAIFEGISDNRIFGVKFDPHYVRVVIAGNTLADNAHMDMSTPLQKFDSALTARTSVYLLDKYSQADVEAVWDYMSDEAANNNGYHPLLVEWFKSLGILRNEVFRQCLESIETMALNKACSSTRALKELTNTFEEPLMAGAVIHEKNQPRIDSIDNISPSDLKGKLSEIVEYIDNWAAKLNTSYAIGPIYEDSDDLGESHENLLELIEDVKSYYESLCSNELDPDFIMPNMKKLEFFEYCWNKHFELGSKDDPTGEISKRSKEFYEDMVRLVNIVYEIDEDIRNYRKEAIANTIGRGGIDPDNDRDDYVVRFDIANVIANYYNKVVGKSDKVYTIQDIVDIDTAKKYMHQWFVKTGIKMTALWAEHLVEIYNKRKDAINSFVYLAAIEQIAKDCLESRTSGVVDYNKEQLITVADSNELKPTFLELENDDQKEKELLRVLVDALGNDKSIVRKYYKCKQSFNVAEQINSFYLDDINRNASAKYNTK